MPKPLVFSLACLIEYYKANEVTDSEYAVDYIKNNDIKSILSNTDLWGQDLSGMLDTVNESLERIHRDGIREAIRWSMS